MEVIRGALFLVLTVLAMRMPNSSALQLFNYAMQDENLLNNSKFKEFEGKFFVLIFSAN